MSLADQKTTLSNVYIDNVKKLFLDLNTKIQFLNFVAVSAVSDYVDKDLAAILIRSLHEQENLLRDMLKKLAHDLYIDDVVDLE